MQSSENKPIGFLNPIFLQGNAEASFKRWFLPARQRMLRVGCGLLVLLLGSLTLLQVLSSGFNWIPVSIYAVSACLCMLMYLLLPSLLSKAYFDLLISLKSCLIAALVLVAAWYTKSDVTVFLITLSLLIVWFASLSGASFLYIALTIGFIATVFAVMIGLTGAAQYYWLAAAGLLALLSLFAGYFRERQLRESFINNQPDKTVARGKESKPRAGPSSEAGFVASNWSKTLKNLSVSLLSVDRADEMFSRLLTLMGGAINCGASAVCLHKDDVLTIVSLQGSLALSNIAAKDIWSTELVRELTGKKTVKQDLAAFGLLESSVKDDELSSDYRLDIPVFSKNNLSAIVTLLRKEVEFTENEIQLASSMIFHAMIALRLAKFQKSTIKKTVAAPASGMAVQEHWLSSRSENFVLYDRKEFIQLAKQDFQNNNHTSGQLSLLLVELDRYSDIEKCYGKLVAQEVFLAVIEMFSTYSREASLIGCYDNGSFAVQVSIDLATAETMAESVRHKIANQVFRIDNNKVRATVSIGVTTMTPASTDYMAMLRCADMGLFLAKDQHGNTVRVSV